MAAKAKRGAAKLGKPFKEVIIEALRIGLDGLMQPAKCRPYRTRGFPMGLREGLNYDNFDRFPGLKWNNPIAPQPK